MLVDVDTVLMNDLAEGHPLVITNLAWVVAGGEGGKLMTGHYLLGNFGINKIHNVIGSSSHDILVGNGGNILTGGAGRDLLIAGLTASQLFGGEGEDILIGGTTIHDQDQSNLNAIRDIWTSDADYNTRVQALRTGLLNDDAGALSSNGQSNTLLGQGGTDLFFLSGLDQHDAIEDEEFVGI